MFFWFCLYVLINWIEIMRWSAVGNCSFYNSPDVFFLTFAPPPPPPWGERWRKDCKTDEQLWFTDWSDWNRNMFKNLDNFELFVLSTLKKKHFLLHCLNYYSIKDDSVLVKKKIESWISSKYQLQQLQHALIIQSLCATDN